MLVSKSNGSHNAHLLFYSPAVLWSRHNLALMDTALDHLEKGGRASVLVCEGALANCPPNESHAFSLCRLCRRQSRHNIDQVLSRRVAQVRLNLVASPSIVRVESFQQLDEIETDGVQLGTFVARELMDEARDMVQDPLNAAEKARATRLLENARRLFRAGVQLFEESDFDRLVVTNGRHDSDGPLVVAARRAGIPTDAVEGHRRDVRILRATNARSVHDPDTWRRRISAAQASLDSELRPELESAASSFFEGLRSGVAPEGHADWTVFPFEPVTGSAPWQTPSTPRPRLAIFPHSEWEYWGMPEYEIPNPQLRSQYGRLRGLLSSTEILSAFDVVVRWHPNLANAGPREQSQMWRMQADYGDDGIAFIAPDSPANSYQLLDEAAAVITFGSTIGVEATYWRKPSILFARTPFLSSGCFYPISSVAEAERLLSNLRLAPRPRETAIALSSVIQEVDLPPLRHFSRAEHGWVTKRNGAAALAAPPLSKRIRALASSVRRVLGPNRSGG